MSYSIYLTDREKQVCRSFIALGSVKQVARALDISPKTVDFHCVKIRCKLQENKTILAAYKAKHKGLI